jgi:hypothetical protein
MDRKDCLAAPANEFNGLHDRFSQQWGAQCARMALEKISGAFSGSAGRSYEKRFMLVMVSLLFAVFLQSIHSCDLLSAKTNVNLFIRLVKRRLNILAHFSDKYKHHG